MWHWYIHTHPLKKRKAVLTCTCYGWECSGLLEALRLMAAWFEAFSGLSVFCRVTVSSWGETILKCCSLSLLTKCSFHGLLPSRTKQLHEVNAKLCLLVVLRTEPGHRSAGLAVQLSSIPPLQRHFCMVVTGEGKSILI